MSSTQTTLSRLAGIGASGYVSAEDVLFLRREVFADGVVSREELQALFALGERAPEGDPAWPAFFEEAAADFYLREEEPQGYLTDAEFESLKAKVTRDSAAASALELRLLVSLLEKAVKVPPAMTAFVADQLRRAIAGKPGGARVAKEETDLVRRFVFASGGEGHTAVTRAEAELIFDINDAVQKSGAADAAWTSFFVTAVANHLMAHAGYAAPSRDAAIARHAFISDHNANIGGFFRRMLAGGLGALNPGGGGKSAYAARNEARDADIRIAKEVTPAEGDWLADRIGRDGAFTDCERALLQHMKKLGADLPPRLRELADKAA